jgi:hypothetical protein
MGRVLSWADEIEVIAGPRLANDTRESWLARAARRAGITFRQCRALYYGETVDPKVSVAIGVVAAAQAARREAAALASRFEAAAGGLNAIDSDFHSSDIAALIHAARRLRGDDRS